MKGDTRGTCQKRKNLGIVEISAPPFGERREANFAREVMNI